MQAKQMIFIEYLDLYSINCRKFEEERFMLGTIFTQSLSGRSNFEEDHVAKRLTVVPDKTSMRSRCLSRLTIESYL